MATYSEIRERCVEGVVRQSTNPPPLDRIRMLFDASIFTVNSDVSERFASQNNERDLLRASHSLTFTAGSAVIPSEVLKKYAEDGTLTVPSTPNAVYGYLKYPQFIRGCDKRLGAWSFIGESIVAIKPQTGAVLASPATFTAITSPSIPADEGDEFDAPEDYVSDLINALIQFILGQISQEAAATS